MGSVTAPSPNILGLSQQLYLAQIPEAVVDELLKSSFRISLKKGDRLNPSLDDEALIYIHSGCLMEVLELSDEISAVSSVWTAGYTLFNLGAEYNRFEHHHNHLFCLFDTELTIITKLNIKRQMSQCDALQRYVLTRSAENLQISHNMALLRYSLDKKQNILLRLLILHIRTEGDVLPLTVDDLSMLTNCTRQYCSGVLQELVKTGVISKHYGHLHVLDLAKLQQLVEPAVLKLISHYMSLIKNR